MTETDLVDSTALVTGVSRGFGRTFQSDALHCRTTSMDLSFWSGSPPAHCRLDLQIRSRSTDSSTDSRDTRPVR